jgi:hypothetical protein
MTREELELLEAQARRMTPAERDELVAKLREAGAPGDAFERMHRAGWRPLSQRAGDGIEGGDLAEVAPRVRRRRK